MNSFRVTISVNGGLMWVSVEEHYTGWGYGWLGYGLLISKKRFEQPPNFMLYCGRRLPNLEVQFIFICPFLAEYNTLSSQISLQSFRKRYAMCILSVSLLGKFNVQIKDNPLSGLDSLKVRELFSYLLIHRNHHHTREALASLLWQDVTPKQSKRYLRKTLWQLLKSLELSKEKVGECLIVDSIWIQINPEATIYLDVAVLEDAFACCEGIPGHQLNSEQKSKLLRAAEIYQGDLLDGWYQDWCLYERERLQRIYLIILGKLVEYCMAHRQYETGLKFGIRILDFDLAHERTYRHLMRLYYLSGDRTKSLRQYQQCVIVLRKELDVAPRTRTKALHQQILSDSLIVEGPARSPSNDTLIQASPPPLYEVLDCLKRIQLELTRLQLNVEEKIEAIEVISTTQDRLEIRIR